MTRVVRLLSDVPYAFLIATCWFVVLWLHRYPVDQWSVVAVYGFLAAYVMIYVSFAIVMIGLVYTGRHLKRIANELDQISDDTRDDGEYSSKWRTKAISATMTGCMLMLPAGLSVLITDKMVAWFGAPDIPGNLVIWSIWVSISGFIGIVMFFGWTARVIYKGRKFLAERAGVVSHTTIPIIDAWIVYWRRRGKSVTDVSTVLTENFRVANRVRR